MSLNEDNSDQTDSLLSPYLIIIAGTEISSTLAAKVFRPIDMSDPRYV